jgi:PAS domain S-box-containing protein
LRSMTRDKGKKGRSPEVPVVDENIQVLLNTTDDMVLLVDRTGLVLAANESAARLFDTTLSQIVGENVYDVVPPQVGIIDKTKVNTAIRRAKPIRFEGVYGGKFFDISLYPVKEDKRSVNKVAIYGHDVTEHKRVEAMLHQTEEKYRHIFENATEGIFQISTEGRFLSANPALARIHGYGSPEELLELITDMATQLYVDPRRRLELMSLVKRQGFVQNFEVQMRRKDGTLHWISINSRAVYDSAGKVIYHEGTMEDITKRKEAEQALEESEDHYRTAVEHSNDGVAIIHGDKHQYVNRRFVEMFGYSRPEEIVGKSISYLIHPDDQERVISMNNQRQRGGPAPLRYEFKGVTKKGGVIYVEVSATNMTYRGTPVSFVYLRDVTERKRAEETLIQSHVELERLNRVKSKAVNHISHELKTPLAIIQGNLRVLRRKFHAMRKGKELENFIDILERNVDRLMEISRETDEIFKVSQEIETSGVLDDLDRLEERMEALAEVPQEVRFHWQELKDWVSQQMSGSVVSFRSIELYPFVWTVVEKVKYLARRRYIEFAVEGENDLYVSMDPNILRDVLEGLIKNAIENTPDGGKVTVRMDEKDDRVWIHVIDTGVGITEENQEYIFDGLFHTKETDLYVSRSPYEFGAGGKGLDLLRLKVYAKRFGFELSMKSRRCTHIPTDRDLCPGNVSACVHIKADEECAASGGTIFSVAFPGFLRHGGPGKKRMSLVPQDIVA